MKNILKIFVTACLLALPRLSHAQAPHWVWAKSDTAIAISINPAYVRPVVAATPHSVLWAVLQNNKITLNETNGDCLLSESDTAGNVLDTTMIRGSMHPIYASADDSGNWYLLGSYYDTLRFTGNVDATRDPFSFSPDHFLARFDAGTMALRWFTLIGADNSNAAVTFDINNGHLYIPVDSGGSATKICSVNLQSGALTTMWTQLGQSRASSIQADSHGNIYLAGSCAFTSIDFNGHTETGPSSYPAYIVRYKAGGQFDWSHWMADVTCVDRALTLASDNSIYYSGNVHDSLTLGSVHFHHPAWVYDFLVASLDSSGHVNWARQLQDTLGGDADLNSQYHAALAPDGSVNIGLILRGYIDWGNNVISNVGLDNTAGVLNIGSNGIANWVINASADYISAEQIAMSNGIIWLTGVGYDSTAIQFGNVSVPTAWQKYTPYLAKASGASPNAVHTMPSTGAVTIVPNPAKDYILINGLANINNCQSLRIKDITGRTLARYDITGRDAFKIGISGYAPGLYFIELSGPSYHQTTKMFFQ